MKSSTRSIIIVIVVLAVALLVLILFSGRRGGENATTTQPTATQAPPTSAPPTSTSPTSVPPTANPIQNINWQWISLTNKTTKETTTVPEPASYTIVFNADGTLNGKADCNNFTGTYSQENGLTIKLGASTMAYCGEASLDQQYLQLLSNVVAGGPDGAGNLALENAGGEQRMLFKNGGSEGEG